MFNIFPISIGDVLQNSGIEVNKDMEYFFTDKHPFIFVPKGTYLSGCFLRNSST